MRKKIAATIPLILVCCFISTAQQLNTSSSFDPNLPDRELVPFSYQYGMPINSDLLTNPPAVPDYDHRYQMSLFGPRYKTTSGTNVTTYDFHQGEDISGDFTSNGQTFTSDTALFLPDSSNVPRLLCMCRGIVDQVVDGSDAAMELLETGRTLRIKCNQHFNTANSTIPWGNVYVAYRHMSKIEVQQGDSVYIGDTLGRMGNSGLTSLVHLHLSVQRLTGTNSFENVHPMRIFDPTQYNHLHRTLQSANIEFLQAWQDSVLFRITVPRAQVCLKRITVHYGSDPERIFDFEDVSQLTNRDDPNAVNGISLLTYGFNRASTLINRYNANAPTMPPFYPASPNRPTAAGYFPIVDALPYNNPDGVCAFDLIVRGLPNGYAASDISIALTDIYGNTVQTDNYVAALPQAIQNEKLRIFPNPASQFLNIHSPIDQEIEFINLLGETVLKTQLYSGSNAINIKALPSGVYLIRCGTTVEKIIKP